MKTGTETAANLRCRVLLHVRPHPDFVAVLRRFAAGGLTRGKTLQRQTAPRFCYGFVAVLRRFAAGGLTRGKTLQRQTAPRFCGGIAAVCSGFATIFF